MPQNMRDTVAPASGGRSGGGGSTPGGGVESGTMALERLRTMLNVPPANRPPDWINPLEKIEQLLTCAICLDRYKNPKLLPCQHSFCMDPCLDGLVDIVRRLVRCPECRAEHPLPYDGVKAFQTNYTLMGFLEIHLQATEENASELESYIRRYNLERCKVCDEKSEVDYCPHCEKRICLECKATHVDMLKRDLGRLMNQVKRLCTRITDTAETLARGIDSLTVSCDNVKEEVHDYVKRYAKELKKREDALVSEVETFYNSETRMIKTVRDNLDLESSNINEACARVEACLKGDREMNDEELVRYKQMFADGLDYLRTVNPDADDLTNKKIRFVVNDAHLLPHAITQFGELQVCTPQYNHKLAQAEQIYVPRFLQLGLESDNYATKRRMWDPNDSNTWQQQSGGKSQQKQAEEDAYSSRYKRRQLLEEQAWNRIRGDHQQQQQQQQQPQQQRQQRHSPKRSMTQEEQGRQPTQFDNSPWSRMQRMNDQPPQQPPPPPPVEISLLPVCSAPLAAPEVAPAAALPPLPPSPNSSGANRRQSITPAQPKGSLKPPQPKKSPPEQLQRANSTEEAATPAPPGPASAAESSIPRPPPRTSKPASPASASPSAPEKSTASEPSNAAAPPAAKGKSNSEERELDKRVATIRKEYEQRQQEQAMTILQIQQRVRTQKVPVDAASAVTASSEEEEEEEEEEDSEEKGMAIPVHVYPRPVVVEQKQERKSSDGGTSIERQLHVNTAETSSTPSTTSRASETPRLFGYPFGKPPVPQQQSNGTIDWKKYLIPSPPDTGAKTGAAAKRSLMMAAASSSPAVNDVMQRQPETPSSIPRLASDDSSWSERRRRFVRSKTNPDFCVDLNQYSTATATNASTDAARGYRYVPENGDSEQRRRRFGFRGDSAGGQESHGSNATATAASTDQRAGPAKTRYRRKAERSHSGYAVTSGLSDDGSEHFHSSEPQRFEISIGGGSETTAAGTGPGARFYRVFTNPKIDYLSKGRCLLKFGCKGNGDGQFNWPRGVATVPTTEEIVVCDSSNHRLQVFDKRGRFLKTLGGYGSGRAEFDCLAGVCVNKYRQYVVSDRYNHRVQIFDSTGRHLREFGAHGQTNGRFNSPWGVAVDQQGFVYVCDKDNHRVQIFQADGNFVGKFGGIGNREGQFQNPHFVACNRQNQLIVTDSSNHRVQVFDHNGHFLFAFGSEGFHEGQFKYPRGVAVDEQGFVVVADSGNNRIQIFYPDGRFYTTFGGWGSNDGQLKGVEGVAIAADGKIVVTDRENHRLQAF